MLRSVRNALRSIRLRAIVAAAGLACFTACSHDATRSATPHPTATPQRVGVVLSRLGTVTPKRTLAGYVAPLQNVTLSTTLAEPAARVDVVEGDRVRAGQILAVFDVSDLEANLRAAERNAQQADANTTRQRYQSSQTIGQGVGSADQAQASVVQAQEKLKLDEVNLRRDVELQNKGFIAAQTTDQQRTTVANDRAALMSAQAAFRAARITVVTNGGSQNGLQGASIAAERAAAESARAQADQIRAQISRATISSPVDGVVINRNLNPGEYPNGRTLFTIAQSGSVYAVMNASGLQITGVRTGQVVTIALNSQPQRVRTAHVVGVLGQTTPGSTNFTVKAQIDTPDETLLGGLPLTGTVALAPVRGTRIPRSAFSDGTETRVVVIRDHRAHAANVRVIAEDASTAIVQGIASGAALVENGDSGVADGTRVDIAR